MCNLGVYSIGLLCSFHTLIADFTAIPDKTTVPILTPAYANRQTSKIHLSNGIEAYLISDPAAEKSAAAMVVGVGSFEDPQEYPGMAHFVEHLLFLGTKQYPDESAFDAFLGNHGGYSNAHTADDHTAFFFTVDASGFQDALTRFSSFFKEPLFNASGVDRELNAVDQEYFRGLQQDDRRRYAVYQYLSNPKHPMHRFSMGNKQTLGKIPLDKLKDWYKDHYSANLMHLIVYSSLPIDQLQKWVSEDLSEVPNHNRAPFYLDMPWTDGGLQGTLSTILPIQEKRSLTLFWELPAEFANMTDTRPDSIVAHILGHEGKESLLATLKKERLATGIQTGGDRIGRQNYWIYVDIDLTKEGLEQWERVAEYVYQAIANLQKNGVPTYVFDNVQTMEKLAYQYQMRRQAYEAVEDYARDVLYEDLSTFPEHSKIIQRYDADAVKKVLSLMTPQRAHISLLNPSADGKDGTLRKEPYFDVSYSVKPLPMDKLEIWQKSLPNSDITSPAPNPFIPQHLSQVQEQIDANKPFVMPSPKILVDDTSGKVYFATDADYLVPKVNWYFTILSPQMNSGDPIKAVMTDLYVKSLKETLNNVAYYAQTAGLYYDITAKEYGIEIAIAGYSENALKLLKEILGSLTTLTIDPGHFKVYKDSLKEEYTNFAKESAVKQAVEGIKSILYKDFSTEKQKSRAIKRISLKRFENYLSTLFEQAYFQVMLYGNLTDNDAKEVWKTVSTMVKTEPYPVAEHNKIEIAVLPQEPMVVELTSQTQSNGIVLAIEDGPFSFKQQATDQILGQALKAPFFSTLRTQQQTGYVVTTWDQELERQLFSFFATQSNSHDPRELLARYELFMESYLQELGRDILLEPEFNSIRDALAFEESRPPENMGQMGDLLNKLAFKYDGDFLWKQKKAEALRSLSYEDFKVGAVTMLGKQNKKRVAVLIKGTFPQEHILEYKKIRSVKEVRKNVPFQPAQ